MATARLATGYRVISEGSTCYACKPNPPTLVGCYVADVRATVTIGTPSLHNKTA
jgi:hypothetical protein